MTEKHLSTQELQLFLDQGMTDTKVREHLNVCEDCSGRLHSTRRLYRLIASVEEEPLRRDLSSAVLAAIRTGRRAQSRLSWLVSLEAILAVLVTLLIAPTLLEQYGPALQAFELMPGTETLTSILSETWSALRDSLLNLTQSFRFDAGEAVNAIMGYPWVLFIAAAAILWVGGNSLLLRLLNRAE